METYSERLTRGSRLLTWQRFARFREAAMEVKRHARSIPVNKLIDIGAADGIGLPFLQPLASDVLSVNYYENHTKEFRAAHPDARVITADARELDLPDCEYDICTSFEALNCVPGRNDRIKCIKEIHRILKPHGLFVCSLPIEVGYAAMIKWFARAITGNQTRGMTPLMVMRHCWYRLYDIDEYDVGCHVGFSVYRFIDDLKKYFKILKTRTIPVPIVLPMNMLIVAEKLTMLKTDHTEE